MLDCLPSEASVKNTDLSSTQLGGEGKNRKQDSPSRKPSIGP
ncbi:hypothetical protein [Candidatus Ichthyocystis sparus]|nr:hypothetical protein [Candidatus Ichthyocystis sparus]